MAIALPIAVDSPQLTDFSLLSELSGKREHVAVSPSP